MECYDYRCQLHHGEKEMTLLEAREIARTLPCPVCKAEANAPCKFIFAAVGEMKTILHINRILQVKQS